MAKVQGKKAAAGGKNVAKKAVARAKSAGTVVKKKPVAAAKPGAAKKPAAKKIAVTAPKKGAKPGPKAAVRRAAKQVAAKAKTKAPKLAKAAKTSAAGVKKAAKNVARATKSVTKKAVKTVAAKAKPPARAVAKAAAKTKSAGVAVAKQAVAAKPKAPAAPAPKLPAPKKLKAVSPVSERVSKPVAVAPAPAAAAPEPEKKRGRRARTRIHSDGSPAAAWLSTEKPRPASFIPAPPRAEAPSAIAAAPASSDRLIRPDDIDHPAVRTVPIRIDVEQSGGRYLLMAQPTEVSVRPGEGIEWDFRYLGGADISVEEIVVEFEKPSPFASTVFRTRKPGGARPHRQLSGAALPAAAGRRIEYMVRAMTPFKTELAKARVVVNVT